MKYFIMNLGCQMNHADSERIQAVFHQMGFSATENEHEAQLIGVVACSVRQKAIDKVYTKIHEWEILKQSKNLITFVSGCILPADEEKFLKRFDLLFSIQDLHKVPEMLKQYGVVTPLNQDFRSEVKIDESPRLGGIEKLQALFTPEKVQKDPMGNFWKVEPKYSSKFEAYVPIQNGCDKFCTFCAVPYTRGREVSRPSTEILDEIERLIDNGYKAVTLLGQNVNSYGKDKPESELSFTELLSSIGELARRKRAYFWTYFTSPHPRDMTRDVLETMAKYPVLAKQIHLPVQSGDDKLLIKMNRNHTMERYRAIVRDIRELMPEATLFTDIIVGFNGETEEQFENTKRAMHEFQYQMAYIAQYSPRPGAASARWEDDVPQETKKERLRILTDVLHETCHTYTKSQLGKSVTVLVEKADRKSGYLSGRTEGRILVRFPANSPELVGRFVTVKITSVVSLSMEGEIVETNPQL